MSSIWGYFLRAWRCFEELCGTFGCPGGHGVPSSIFRYLGCNLEGLETSVFDANGTLDGLVSICSFNVIIGMKSDPEVPGLDFS